MDGEIPTMRSFADLLMGESTPVGIFVKIPALEVAELVVTSGFDFVIIDSEHALLGPRDIYEMIVAYQALGVSALVRLPDHRPSEAQRILDAGASGVLFPHVADSTEAAALVEATRFPPNGRRGMGYASRAGKWGLLEGGREEYLRSGESGIARIAMIEDGSAVDDLLGIAETTGIDALFVGPSDLSLSLGVVPGSDEIRGIVSEVVRRAKALEIPVGTTVANAADAAGRRAEGCSFLVLSNDTGILARSLSGLLADVRDGLANGVAS